MAGEVRVGTSGWQYRDWRRVVYPAGMGQPRWLAHYTTLLPTVEINATFYRLAREDAARRWASTVPPGFEFSIKGSRYITHQRRLRDPGAALERFFAPLAPVLDRTAVVLWQLPPRFGRDVERLDAFLAALPNGPRYAVEFRDDDWFDHETYHVLDRHGAANVWLSSSITTRHVGNVRTGDHVYVRFHGLAEQPYRYCYSEDELVTWAELLRESTADGTPAWVYFNNDYCGYAVDNARALVRLLGDSAYPWPRAGREGATTVTPAG